MNTRILVRRVGVAFALLGALAAHAEPASEAAAQELLKVSQAESMLTAARANLEQQMRDTMDSMLAQEKLVVVIVGRTNGTAFLKQMQRRQPRFRTRSFQRFRLRTIPVRLVEQLVEQRHKFRRQRTCFELADHALDG